MRRSPRLLLLAVPLLLTGCATHVGGMSMGTGTPAAATAPPATAAMVCGPDIKTKVKQVLSLAAQPSTSSTWASPRFTCTYALPMGPMSLRVHVLPSKAAAGATFDRDQAAAAGAHGLPGLGERAWGTPDGTTEVLKDNQILTVDTTALPVVFGANDQKRTDLAFEVASDVLGCWTGDGDE